MKLENMAEMLVLRRLDIRRALAMTDGSRLNVRLVFILLFIYVWNLIIKYENNKKNQIMTWQICD